MRAGKSVRAVGNAASSADVDYARWLAALDTRTFDEVAGVAETMVAIHQALANDGVSVLHELFRDSAEAPVEMWIHYPPDDCRDPDSGAMFYYHIHDPRDWARNEHGHFHLFVRPSSQAAFSHAMAVSMTPHGLPSGLFTTNQWVTDETVRPAAALLQLMDERWEIARARPSWLVVQWLKSLVTLVRPHAEVLLCRRDEALEWTAGRGPSVTALEDRTRHILSEMPLDLMAILGAVQAETSNRDQTVETGPAH